MMESHRPRKQAQTHAQTSRSKPAFAVFSDAAPSASSAQARSASFAVAHGENKENEDPSGKRKAAKSKPVLGVKPANSQPAAPGQLLWEGKKPFAPASPEGKARAGAGGKQAKDIYSLPGVPAKSQPAPLIKKAAVPGMHVNRPNKPVAARTQMDADRRCVQLTESPLADVTRAYTGTGAFASSPTMHNRLEVFRDDQDQDPQVASPVPIKRRPAPALAVKGPTSVPMARSSARGLR